MSPNLVLHSVSRKPLVLMKEGFQELLQQMGSDVFGKAASSFSACTWWCPASHLCCPTKAESIDKVCGNAETEKKKKKTFILGKEVYRFQASNCMTPSEAAFILFHFRLTILKIKYYCQKTFIIPKQCRHLWIFSSQKARGTTSSANTIVLSAIVSIVTRSFSFLE